MSIPIEPTPIVIRSKRFWFQRGDVVLHVENTQFKVHREMLSLHSNVFKDTFSMPQNDDGHSEEPLVDGCPVVPLSDKTSDVEHMLSIFYDNFRAHNWRESMHVDYLSPLLRLGKKYEIDHFTEEAVRRLRADHPITLKAWDAHLLSSTRNQVVWDFDDPEQCAVINLAHEHSLLSILPVAYLRYVQWNSLETIIRRKRGLCSEAQLQCILGRAKILDFVRNRLTEWYDYEVLTPGDECSTLQTCGDLRLGTVHPYCFALWAGFDEFEYSLLHPLDKCSLFGLCPKCTKAIKTRYNDIRAQLWEKLPTFFGLPQWKDLEKETH